MSEFSKELQITAEFCHERPIDVFSKHIPLEWVEEAIQQTGRTSLRKRRLPAEQAVWLVLGIGLQRNRSIQDVCDKLELALPDVDGKFTPMATSSIKSLLLILIKSGRLDLFLSQRLQVKSKVLLLLAYARNATHLIHWLKCIGSVGKSSAVTESSSSINCRTSQYYEARKKLAYIRSYGEY